VFRGQDEARRCAIEVEYRIDQGLSVDAPPRRNAQSLAQPIDLHIDDLCSVGNAPKRSNAYCLDLL
jgi:hypothetical protein